MSKPEPVVYIREWNGQSNVPAYFQGMREGRMLLRLVQQGPGQPTTMAPPENVTDADGNPPNLEKLNASIPATVAPASGHRMPVLPDLEGGVIYVAARQTKGSLDLMLEALRSLNQRPEHARFIDAVNEEADAILNLLSKRYHDERNGRDSPQFIALSMAVALHAFMESGNRTAMDAQQKMMAHLLAEAFGIADRNFDVR